MTPDEIAAMPAGREMDARVAETVMGWLVVEGGGEDWYERLVTRWPCLVMFPAGNVCLHRSEYGESESWKPSTDIAAAWEVVEHLQKSGWWLLLTSPRKSTPLWTAVLPGLVYSESETAPLAICRAALLAVVH